jgi:large subunit ribosomal protein L7/L12
MQYTNYLSGVLKVENIIEAIKKMSVMELVELKKALEKEFGVTAAAPMSFAPASTGTTAPEAAKVEEKTDFTIVLVSAGEKKIQVVKEIRAITGLGLKESKELVDGAPNTVKESAPKEEAEKIKAKLEEVGATVELK